MTDFNRTIAGLVNQGNISIEELQGQIARTDASDPKAQIKEQDYLRDIASVTNRYNGKLGENR